MGQTSVTKWWMFQLAGLTTRFQNFVWSCPVLGFWNVNRMVLVTINSDDNSFGNVLLCDLSLAMDTDAIDDARELWPPGHAASGRWAEGVLVQPRQDRVEKDIEISRDIQLFLLFLFFPIQYRSHIPFSSFLQFTDIIHALPMFVRTMILVSCTT